MSNLKRLLSLTIFYMPFIVDSQVISTSHGQSISKTGIKWTEKLTWQQVQEKAKAEKKYIFIDAFATWCGPCKKMDNEVYPNDTIGTFFNSRFVSVKVQMDKTQKDNEQVKSWYNDAAAIYKQYKIEGFPSYVFFSPEGIIVHKEMGYKTVNELMAVAQAATAPGKSYVDPYAAYDRLVADFKRGIKKTDSMVYMIKTAFKLGEEDLAHQILKDYTDYCETVKPEQRYTKENIEMWAAFVLASTTRAFDFFYRDGDIINKVMNKKDLAEAVVCHTIEDEIMRPFLEEQSGSKPTIVGGVTAVGSGVKSDYTEADWKKLYKIVHERYNTYFAKRILLNARILWYTGNNNRYKELKYRLLQLEKYPPDLTDPVTPGTVNSIGWKTFLYSTDKKMIKNAIGWMEKAVIRPRPSHHAVVLDTYANLLYKAGRKSEAIQWQEKAINAETRETAKKKYQKALEQMRRGEPTYLNAGAVWK